MGKFGETLFGGSRFIFWTVSPCLLVTALALPFQIELTPLRELLCAAILVCSVLLILGLYNPRRFNWALRCVTGFVFLAYAAYAVDEFFIAKHPIRITKQSEASPFNAARAMIIIALPCLWFTLFGRFSFRNETGQGQPDGRTGGESPVDALGEEGND